MIIGKMNVHELYPWHREKGRLLMASTRGPYSFTTGSGGIRGSPSLDIRELRLVGIIIIVERSVSHPLRHKMPLRSLVICLCISV